MSPYPPLPYDEEKRIHILHELNILDTPPEERFDRITRLARQVFQVPIALISLVDTNRQWFKSSCGIVTREKPREQSFCAYTLLDRRPLIISDAHEDPRFADNPLVTQEPFIRFYAGYPLKGPEGYILGTLCILDRIPRQFQPHELDLLYDLAQFVEHEIYLSTTRNIIVDQWKQSHLFHSIFDHAALGMMVLDRHGTFIEWNHAFEQLVGYQREALQGLCATDIIDEQYQSQMNQVLHDLFTHAISFRHVEHQYTRLDGTTLTLSTTLSIVHDMLSEQDFCIGLLEDITVRTHAEQQVRQVLQEKEELTTTLQALVEATKIAIVFLSRNEQVDVVNRCFLEWFDLDQALLLHASFDQFCDQLLPLFAPEQKLPGLFQQDRSDPDHSFTERVEQVTPQHREIELQSYPVYLPSKDYFGRLYLMRDITKERETEQLRNEFVSLVSHELRTPLTSIKGFVALLLEDESGQVNQEQHEFLSVIDENAERLIALVNELLDIARIEAGKIDLQCSPLNLEQLCRKLATSFEPILSAKKQHLTLQFLGPTSVVFGDQQRLQQVISNLLSNASKYTPAGGSLHLCTQQEEHQLRVSIQDTGIGMTAEEQARLFTKFYRVRNHLTKEVSGTGLGLAITRSLIELHGGVIQVESAPEKGSTFSFTLPLIAESSSLASINSQTRLSHEPLAEAEGLVPNV